MASPTFKEIIERDITDVFFNLEEFSDTHTIDGTSMTAMNFLIQPFFFITLSCR